MRKLAVITLFIHVIISFISINWGRKKEIRQDRKLYIALMLGGFIWSQLQTEYLILRINKKIDNKKSFNYREHH
ncbi:hypothetical protein [Heyndrickxia ginsengihumi]|uniref:Uncharacterized protein n=1 Tax=Heyndrickxia ginsengihumi TaxID=363870 RepID=A0A6M0P8W3_9BACI|nr:hypothetical protein [Heyndrickxia ginsengihumi]MBE6185138.1 hypothetical protein [Bacillus sp. (in: firmicutes)]MCM3025047.1 hypothetical protein [Heyndrickxia ginsengihumi]NEY20469.1 hypothetical protein [Heyndrickxia ginsengihumi]